MTTSITTPPLSVAELLDQDFTFHYRHCSFHKLVKNEHTSTLLRTNLPICVLSVGQYLGSLGTMSSTIRAGISKTCQRLLYPSSECRVISAGAKIDRVLSRKWRIGRHFQAQVSRGSCRNDTRWMCCNFRGCWLVRSEERRVGKEGRSRW